ncbi:MAG: DnaJ C-terminal domain-containing protein [Alphaproteobacteria bacterium]|nr:DnaJ C-terminal domain-containing protein [Alphaproteobacteria bacterium]
MPDPYQTLGVSKNASAAEIKSAYRKLAKKLHPDVNPGRKDIEQKFKEVTAAYDLLSDTSKRARYDRGEIDEMGNERGFAHAGADPFGGMGGRTRTYRHAAGDAGNHFSGLDMEDLLSGFFGGGRGPRGATPRGSDATYALAIPFAEACLGGKRRFTLANGKTVDVNIPPGSNDGDKLRLRGQGASGASGAGDAIIEIHIEPHPYFTRKDSDIHLEAPVSLSEAVLGASIRVPTLSGHVAVKVPKGANTGTTLRLKGKGVPKTHGEPGDMLVKLKIMLPDTVPHDLAEAIEKWAKKHPYDPRKKLGWG